MHVGDLAHVHLQRVDAQVVQAGAGQPLGQHLDVQRLAVAGADHGHAGQPHQRVLRAFRLGAAGHRAGWPLPARSRHRMQPLDQRRHSSSRAR